MENNKSITDLICPITGSPLWYVGTEKHCMDPDSWYSPESDSSIIFARHPFSMNLFRLVETKGTMEKALRYFRLNTDRSWTEMKEAPYTNSLFPLDDFSEEWEAACKEGLERLEKRKQQEQYWKEHPEEDPRVFAKTVALEKVDVVPLGPPTGILFYLDYKYNPDIQFMIKNFGDFLNENLSDRRIADAVIYTCLLGFLPDGGNNNGEDDWEKVDKIFKDGGPDLFRNFGPDEFKSNGTYDELVALSKMYGKRSDSWSDTESNHRYLTNESFSEFDLKIEKITPDETIIHLSPQKQSGVKQFYTELRPAYLKELAEKLKTHISSKQYGL